MNQDGELTKFYKELNSHVLALASLLIDKGIITLEEYEKYLGDAKKCMEEKHIAEIKKARKEFKKQYPNMSKIFNIDNEY